MSDQISNFTKFVWISLVIYCKTEERFAEYVYMYIWLYNGGIHDSSKVHFYIIQKSVSSCR